MSEAAKSYSEQRLEDDFNAFVLFTKPFSFRSSDLVQALNDQCGSVAKWDAPDQVGESGLIVASDGDESTLVFIMSLPVPVPIDHYEASVRRAITFPRAQAALEAHQTHYTIMAKSSGTDVISRFKAARIVTCVSAMFARSDACTAVLFPSGDIIADPAAWQDVMYNAMRDQWPFASWISFEIRSFAPEVERGSPSVSCSSVGMAAFNGHEATFPASLVEPGEAFKQVLGAIFLLLQSGNAFSDGDTIGIESSDEKLRLRYAKEGFMGLQTNTWVILHPNCTVDEGKLFPRTDSVPPPPGLDTSVQPRPGFFSRLLRLGQRTH